MTRPQLLAALLTLAFSPPGAGALSASIRIGTRPSPLALAQADAVASALIQASAPGKAEPEIVPIDATGDRPGSRAGTQDVPLAMKGVDFTGLLDDALLERRIDVAVHSLKDIPPANRWRGGLLSIGCHLGPRADPSDVLVGRYESFESLPPGARVGSASLRRQAQLLAARPDVAVVNLRGNVHARLAALDSGDVDAIILAAAGLERLGLLKSKSAPDSTSRFHPIPPHTMLPGAAQGIVAAVCRSDDDGTLALLRPIDNHDSRIAAITERSLLDTVDGSAPWPGRPPVAALMERAVGGGNAYRSDWTLRGSLATPDGAAVVRTRREAPADCNEEEAYILGREVGEELLRLAGSDFFSGY